VTNEVQLRAVLAALAGAAVMATTDPANDRTSMIPVPILRAFFI
jgi:hypothetical protein